MCSMAGKVVKTAIAELIAATEDENWGDNYELVQLFVCAAVACD